MTSDPLRPSMESPSPRAPLAGIVAIGASAGGLEAFQKLLPRLSDTTGFAFVFLQHLDPSRRSQLDQILAPLTRMPVERIHAGQPVEPNHVYVLPEGCLISLQDGHFETTPRSENPHSPFSPIDFFLESLSRNPLLLSIGVLLSGTGHDGVAGLHHIKSQDGITFAQSSESSRSPEMPFAAERAGAVDFVLPPEEIAAEILRISKTPRFGELLSDPKPSSLPAHAEPLHPAYQKILRILRASTGVDFADYRDNTIRRRIHRRMLLSQCDSLAEYAKNLEANRPEIEALYRDILINVTSFFRDPEMFEALKTVVFPEILKHKSPGEPIRIWVPGCSSGQEVYSIAICLLEFLEPLAQPPAIQIFGTDLSESNAVERARAGLYPAPLADEISPERLARFFTKEDGSYRINRQVRDLCIFAKQNVAVDPPFSRMDLISCRNLLIYLSNGLQKRIIPAFHYSLLSNGFLVLGASETVGRFTDLFQAVDSKNRIYSKISSIQRSYPHFHHLPPAPQPILPLPLSERSPGPVDLQKEADRVLLSRFAPAGVLVSEELEVLQFRGRTGAFLEPPPGEASFNLLRMARESLFSPIRSAIDEARAHHRPARRAGIRLREEDSLRVIDLEVIPLRLPGSPRSGFLVLFSPTAVSPGNRPPQAEQGPSPAPSFLPPGPTAPAPRPDASQTEEIQQLQSDLTNAKEYLQSIIEQQSAGNEELRAANEDVLSANEQLRSANEELQTSKEELQSTNEEPT
ncbi:MAG: hypothetical protein RLZZ142_2687, partial [Verrucomicrobiota bacterium]